MLLVTRDAGERKSPDVALDDKSQCLLLWTDMMGSALDTLLSGVEDVPTGKSIAFYCLAKLSPMVSGDLRRS